MNLVEKAEYFARGAHSGQFRKWTGEPYIVHPAAVALSVEKYGIINAEVIAAAWLHDTMEDCGTPFSTLVDLFGMNVAAMVEDLTSLSKLDCHKNKPRSERKRIDCKYLELARPMSQLIKVFDRLDNLKTLKLAPEDFHELYAKETLLLADSIKKVDRLLIDKLREEASVYLISHIRK